MAIENTKSPGFTITIGDVAEKRLGQELQRFQRFQMPWDALCWRLKRRPQSGTPIPGLPAGHYIAKTASWAPGGLPSLAIAYVIQGDNVHVLSLRTAFLKKRKP